MNQPKFTKQEVEELLKNKNIIKCSQKSISFSKKFKIKAVQLYEQGLTPSEIFDQADFNLRLVDKDQRSECLRRWNKLFRKKGSKGLSESRGRNSRCSGRPKINWTSDEERIEYLEAKVAYLKAENDFLVKLRAKRAG